MFLSHWLFGYEGRISNRAALHNKYCNAQNAGKPCRNIWSKSPKAFVLAIEAQFRHMPPIKP
jgi:hypothetical protein